MEHLIESKLTELSKEIDSMQEELGHAASRLATVNTDPKTAGELKESVIETMRNLKDMVQIQQDIIFKYSEAMALVCIALSGQKE